MGLSRRGLALLAPVLLGAALLAFMYWTATRDLVVRRARLAMPDWPAGARSVRVALLSDIHVGGPDMPPERLARVVEQTNRLRPDLVLFAGDFVSDKRTSTRTYPADAALAPLGRLRAPLGAVAVLGNHDHWRGAAAITAALRAARIRVLDNEAFTAGPLRLGGVDDAHTGRADVPTTVARMRAGPGARVLLSHSPDVAPSVPADVTLVVAGHTHRGQIRLPFVGAVSTMSAYGNRYACGLVREGRRRVVIGAGVGTSVLPLRLGARPDLWLLTLGPRA